MAPVSWRSWRDCRATYLYRSVINMSAHAYIQWADVPAELARTSRQHVDSGTRAQIVAFDGCPVCGQIERIHDAEPATRIQVEFPFPTGTLRTALVDWLMHHRIGFRVVQ